MSTTTTTIGKVGNTPKGAWSSQSLYERLDIVSSNGSSYMAKQNVPAGTSLSDTTYWLLIASKGNDGDPAPSSEIVSAVENWLGENFSNPSNPPLDRSLSSNSSAAPADLVGNLDIALNLINPFSVEGEINLLASIIGFGIYRKADGTIDSSSNSFCLLRSINLPNDISQVKISTKLAQSSTLRIVFFDNTDSVNSSTTITLSTANSFTFLNVPTGTKYFEIFTTNNTLAVSVIQNSIINTVNDNYFKSKVFKNVRFGYINGSGVYSDDAHYILTNAFSLKENVTIYSLDRSIRLRSIYFANGDVTSTPEFSSWSNEVCLIKNLTYMVLIQSTDNTISLTYEDIKKIQIDQRFGMIYIDSLNTSTNVPDIAASGYGSTYWNRNTLTLKKDELPIVFPKTSSASLSNGILVAFPYVGGVHEGTLQFLTNINVSNPTLSYRLTYDGEQYSDWKTIGNNIFGGKNISIFGDSISTFAGYIDDNATYYNGSNCGVTSVTDTYWNKVITALGANLLKNNSYSGRKITQDWVTSGNNVVENAGYRTNVIKKLAVLDGTDIATAPDIIIIALGINDYNGEIELGTYDGTTSLPSWSQSSASAYNVNNTYSKNDKAKYQNNTFICKRNGVTGEWNRDDWDEEHPDFLTGYALMLNTIMTLFPLAQIYCCTLINSERNQGPGFPEINGNGDSKELWNSAMKKLFSAFGVHVLNISECGITQYNLRTYAGDYESSGQLGLHPNAAGHSLIANQILHDMDSGNRIRY